MSIHHTRAEILIEQSKYDMALRELQAALAEDPDDGHIYARMAWCLMQQDKNEDAIEYVKKAIALSPEASYPHYVLGVIHVNTNNLPDARKHAETAIEMEPDVPHHHWLRGMIYFNAQRWTDALACADHALSLDPENIPATNLRGMVMSKLGRHEEAETTISEALRRAPENSHAHANKGWSLLHRNDHQTALVHFREALRLDPTDEWARQGMLIALKAKYIIYRWILQFYLMMMRLDTRVRFGLIIGLYFAYKILKGIANNNAAVAPYIWPVLALYIAFVILTWIADPIFNSLLRLNRFGRYALDEDDRHASNWFMGMLIVAMGFGIGGFALGNPHYYAAALMSLAMVLPLTQIYSTPAKSVRKRHIICAAAFGLAAVLSIGFLVAGYERAGIALMVLFSLAFWIYVMAGGISSVRRPEV